MRSPWHDAPRRRALWFALIALVTLAHLVSAAWVAATVIGWDGSPPPPPRIDVELVQDFFISIANHAGITAHIDLIRGEISHHII